MNDLKNNAKTQTRTNERSRANPGHGKKDILKMMIDEPRLSRKSTSYRLRLLRFSWQGISGVTSNLTPPRPSFLLHRRHQPPVNLLMPKKRFTPQYSKPQSTVHPSLQSPATASSTSSTNSSSTPPQFSRPLHARLVPIPSPLNTILTLSKKKFRQRCRPHGK
jgi:hypothetical protein